MTSLSKIEKDWQFPLTGGGTSQGFMNQGEEHFKKNDRFSSMAREVIQNSLDARHSSNLPVRVQFSLEQQASSAFPGRAKLLNSLEICCEENTGNEKVEKFYQNAIQTLKNTHLDILKISDFNTKGLNKISWNWLVKSTGKSEDKESTAGGSYGFGKYAPFTSSNLKTIFYSTLDHKGQYLFQGKSVLQSHYIDNDKKRETQPEGYYGLNDELLSPVDEKDDIDSFYCREQPGTDIFIMGFKQDKQWEDKIIIEVLKSFFPALHQEKLVVHVGDKTLKKAGLEKMFAEYGSDKYKAINRTYFLSEYYEAFTAKAEVSGQQNMIEHTIEDLRGMGELSIKTFRRDGLPKREVYFRNSGMIIEENTHRGTVECISIVEIKGEQLSEFLRKTENPAHDTWEEQRNSDPLFARAVLKSIREAVKETRDALIDAEGTPEVDFKGMENFLPDDIDHVDEIDNDLINEKINKPAPIEIKKIKYKKNPNQVINDEDNAGDEGGSGGGDGSGGDGSGGGSGDGGGSGGDGDDGSNESEKKPQYTEYSLNKIRVIETSELGNLIVIASAAEDKSVYLKLAAAAEDAATYQLKIEKAIWQGAEVDINASNNLIGPIDLKADKEIKLHVILMDKERVALGVGAHELK